MLPDPSPETWIQIRYEYEHTDKPVDDICLDHGVSPSTLRERMRRWRWTRRRQPISAEGPPPMPMPIARAAPLAPFVAPAGASAPLQAAVVASESATEVPAPLTAISGEVPPDPALIVTRLQGAVARVLPAIEATVEKLAAGPMSPREMERAARTLTSLTRTLRELNGLLSQHQARPACDCDCDMPEDIDAFRIDLARRIDAFVASETGDGAQQET
jgi:transposase-like protein